MIIFLLLDNPVVRRVLSEEEVQEMEIMAGCSQVVHLRNVIAGPNLAEALKRAEFCLASGHFWLVLNRRKIATCVPLNYILIPTNKYANISSFSL